MSSARSDNALAGSAIGCIVADGPIAAHVRRGVAEIQRHAPIPVDILHGRSHDDSALARYAWVVTLPNDAAEPDDRSAANALGADAWAVEVAQAKPPRLRIHASNRRGQLYALFHLAHCMAAHLPPSAWPIERRPRVPKRYAWVSAGNAWSPVFRPDHFERAIAELAGMGFNGVLLTFTPTHGTSVGREPIPFSLTEDAVDIDHARLPPIRALFDRLKRDGLDICLFHQAFTPPPFTSQSVREHYAGERELPGFATAVEQGSNRLASAIFTHLPQVDGLLHHSIECDWIWGDAVSIFPCSDDATAGAAFEAYLRGLSDACRAHDKDLMYWTHVSGVSARQVHLQHRLLDQFPDVIVIEDHAWPNNMWPFAAPMAHLTADERDRVTQRRFGISIDTTDGEYYGAGALPTAYPDTHVRAGQAAAQLGAEVSFVRLNAQSLGPYGTMDDINAIHVIATAEQWWDTPRPLDDLWHTWCVRRFGTAAASDIEAALKKSSDFITKGVSAGGMPLIDHSGLATHSWQPNSTFNSWALFARPGELLVDKPYDELVGNEFRPWQIRARGVALGDFLHDSAQADNAVDDALRRIEHARPNLTPEDAAYLSACFEDAKLMIEAVRLTAVAAHASAACVHDGEATDQAALHASCTAMEDFADHVESVRGSGFRAVHWFMKTRYKGELHAGYGAPLALRALADTFRRSTGVRSPRSSDA